MEELALARLQTRGTAGRHTAGHRTKRGKKKVQIQGSKCRASVPEARSQDTFYF